MDKTIRFWAAALLALLLAGASGWARADREWRGGQFGGQLVTVGGHRGQHFSGRHNFQRHHRGHFRHRPSRHHFRSHLFIGIGDPFFWPWYYPPRYVAPAQVVVQPPPIYVEQAGAPAAPATGYYWYYCRSRAAYYPYVSRCAEPWERVTPTPGAPQ